MTQGQVTRLTWNKTFVLVTSAFLAGAVVDFLLLSRRLYLVPPLTNVTPVFYLLLVSVPAAVTLTHCMRRRPSGSRINWVLLPIWLGVLFCLFLIVAPQIFFYSALDCQSVKHSGLFVQHGCTCRTYSIEARALKTCSLEGFVLSPLLPVMEWGTWEPIP